MGLINQTIEFKKPVNVIYEGRITPKMINVVKAYILRSGKPGFLTDEKGESYDFEYVYDKETIYRTIIRNLMFKDLI